MQQQVIYLVAILAVSLLTACERVPEGPQAEEKPGDVGTVVTLSVTNIIAGSSTEQAAGTRAGAPHELAATTVTSTSTTSVPKALFALTAEAVNEEECAAACVARYVVGEHVYCAFSPTSAPLRLAIEALPRGAAPRTVAVLVNIVEPAVDANIVALGSWQPSNLFALALSPFRTYFLWGYAQDVHSVTPIATGTWVHLAATYDGTTATLYVNGVAERQLPLALETSIHGLQLGGRRFHGMITDVRVWDSALSAAEIACVAKEALEKVAGNTAQSTVPVPPSDEAEGEAENPCVTAEPPTSRE